MSEAVTDWRHAVLATRLATAASKGEERMRSMGRRLALLLLFVGEAAWAGPESRVAERAVYTFPPWGEAAQLTDVEKYSTEAEYVAACDGRYVLEKIRYRSDGLGVIAYFFHPAPSEGRSRPVVVFNRGSYLRKDIAPELLPTFYRLAEAGFAVVAPLYRGSDGGEGRDEMGGADLNDLLNVVPLLAELEGLDTSNLFLYGESRGGMMVFQAIRDGFPARAAATLGAFTDLGELTSSGGGAAMARTIWPDFDARREEVISRRSAIQWPGMLGIPLLLMHGSADGEVPPTQTLRLATELARAHKELGVVIVPGGNHVLRQHRLEHDRHVVEFFRRFVVE